MCTVSMIGDVYSDKWRKDYPGIDWDQIPNYPKPIPNYPTSFPNYPTSIPPSDIQVKPLASFIETLNKEEIEALKKEVEMLKVLLRAAIKYDEENDEPECETAEKVRMLKIVADAVGVDLEGILK